MWSHTHSDTVFQANVDTTNVYRIEQFCFFNVFSEPIRFRAIKLLGKEDMEPLSQWNTKDCILCLIYLIT